MEAQAGKQKVSKTLIKLVAPKVDGPQLHWKISYIDWVAVGEPVVEGLHRSHSEPLHQPHPGKGSPSRA